MTDNGEGIDPERLGRVFDAYFSTRAGGLGMGLAISRTIIEAHQGRITVSPRPESRQPSGSPFRPAVTMMKEQWSTSWMTTRTCGTRSRWLMKTVGLRAKTFPSAAGFLRDFARNGPGCLVLDVRMPGTSGLDLFEELVARGEGMPVIFITAYADVPMAVRAMKSGAVEFVEKPFNRQTLLDKVQRAIKDDAERRGRARPDRDRPGEIPTTDRQGERGPRAGQAGTAEQGDRQPAGDHAPRRRAAAVEPDAQARCPLAGGAAPADNRAGDRRRGPSGELRSRRGLETRHERQGSNPNDSSA